MWKPTPEDREYEYWETRALLKLYPQLRFKPITRSYTLGEKIQNWGEVFGFLPPQEGFEVHPLTPPRTSHRYRYPKMILDA